jgi:hypothetical protein
MQRSRSLADVLKRGENNREWASYAGEADNFANLIMLLLLIYIFVKAKSSNMTSEIIDVYPDRRQLSFPFVSLEIKKHFNAESK